MNDTALFPPIETARLLLRCVEAGDAAATAALITPAVSQWVARWPYPFTTGMAAARIAASRAIMRACGMSPAGERMIPVPAHGRDELCRFYEVHRPPHHGNAAFPVPGTNG